MTVTTVLALILFLLMFVIGGWKGVGAFISLWLNFAVLVVMIMLISFGFNAMWILLIGGALVLTITVLSAGATERVTMNALIASMIVMLILAVLIFPAEHLALAQGFAEQNSEELEGLSLGISVPFVIIGVVAALLATLGAIAEASVAVAASLDEMLADQKQFSIPQMMMAGTRVGQQIVGTAVNTILFGFMADFLSLAIWFAKLKYTWGEILNAKLFTSSMMSMVYAILGVILVLPITLGLYRIQEQRKLHEKEISE